MILAQFEVFKKNLKNAILTKDKEMVCRVFNKLLTCDANISCYDCGYKDASSMNIGKMAIMFSFANKKLQN